MRKHGEMVVESTAEVRVRRGGCELCAPGTTAPSLR